MNKHPTADTLNRLALSLMEKYDEPYDQAILRLETLKLRIICAEQIARSRQMQVALITAVNCGARAFLGGVFVDLPSPNCEHLTVIPGTGDLQSLIEKYGGHVRQLGPEEFEGFTLTIGKPALADHSLQLVFNSWQGGVIPSGYQAALPAHDQLDLGATAAAAMGVGTAFMYLSGIDHFCAQKPSGISLWKPDVNWLHADAVGPTIENLPERLWVLGLGHLGQSYAWNFALLPFINRATVRAMLQDDDRLSEANRSAGVLSFSPDTGEYKTAIVRRWLRATLIDAKITERRFDEYTKRAGKEPFVAVCGFDNAASRRFLEDAGFHLVVEAGLGTQLNGFDDIVMHSFPSIHHQAAALWKVEQDVLTPHPGIFKHFEELKKEGCGIVPLTLASKSISSSFVGMLAGALVIAEIVRASNCGQRFDLVNLQVRDLRHLQAFADGSYTTEAAANGLAAAQRPEIV